MVPGSMFRYGSNFCRATRTPRLSNRHPMEAAAIPFPKDETTPPVTKMYLGNRSLRKHEKLVHALQILRCIDTERFIVGRRHADAVTVLEGAKLLQAFGLFQRPNSQIRIAQQEVAPVHI